MNAPSFLQQLRVTRRKCKSQAFVEFAFILPIFLIMMMCVFDYSFMVMRQQILAMAAREGANTASRQLPDVAINEGLNAAYNAARSVAVDFFSGNNGGVIITHVWYDSAYVSPNQVLVLDSAYTGPRLELRQRNQRPDGRQRDQRHRRHGRTLRVVRKRSLQQQPHPDQHQRPVRLAIGLPATAVPPARTWSMAIPAVSIPSRFSIPTRL